MPKVSARDAALLTISAATAGALALLVRLPRVPDENNLLGLAGSLIGAAIAVAAGLIVLGRQFETVDERQLSTVKSLLGVMKVTALALQHADAPLNPTSRVQAALRAFRAAQAVSTDLRASGPHFAAVSQLLEESGVRPHLIDLCQPGLGIADADLVNTGRDIINLVDDALARLRQGF